jgi:hypothetical protein
MVSLVVGLPEPEPGAQLVASRPSPLDRLNQAGLDILAGDYHLGQSSDAVEVAGIDQVNCGCPAGFNDLPGG